MTTINKEMTTINKDMVEYTKKELTSIVKIGRASCRERV